MLRMRAVKMMARPDTPVRPLHFLQKHDIRVQLAQTLTQLMQHKAPLELRISLVDIVGGYFERGHIR
jgi:hypothetical protein